LAGCSLFGKKSAKNDATPPPNPAGIWPPTQNTGLAGTNTPTRPNSGALLAGSVVDSYGRVPPATYIQVVSAQENDGKAAPIEVAVDTQGYFIIPGLKPGQSYELTARTRDGNPKLAGRTWARPPNARVVINMSPDFATPNTPAAPGPPAIPGQKGNPTSSLPSQGFGDQAASDLGRSPTGNSEGRGVDIGAPLRVNEPPPASAGSHQRRTEVHPENVVADPNGLARGNPVISIPTPETRPQPAESTPPAAAPPFAPTPARQVPFCVLTGKQLDNFALYDVNGQAWEYRNRRGKIVLLDFFGTWCTPCRNAIPHLNILQQNYRRAGLEVVGIDYQQDEPTFQEHARRVQYVRDRMQINYRLLLGGTMMNCPVRTQFDVQRFPTLVLLDENSRIIWRSEGLEQVQLEELTMLIRQRLGAR
jgi:thiol-disulfide isomerase/thioredoxin